MQCDSSVPACGLIPNCGDTDLARKREIIASGVTDPWEYRGIKGEFLKEVLG